ncbi:ACT domain-containing protein ACR8-like [Asparagus officinalis]|nr:ACT domain-containing protein ACR8-like [Asparagus officinalis]
MHFDRKIGYKRSLRVEFLYQMMFADRDFERRFGDEPSMTSVSVQNWIERGYSVVGVQCRDRPKLLFDVVRTLTDLKYVVFQGTIDTDADRAHLDDEEEGEEGEENGLSKCIG